MLCPEACSRKLEDYQKAASKQLAAPAPPSSAPHSSDDRLRIAALELQVILIIVKSSFWHMTRAAVEEPASCGRCACIEISSCEDLCGQHRCSVSPIRHQSLTRLRSLASYSQSHCCQLASASIPFMVLVFCCADCKELLTFAAGPHGCC